MIMKKKHSSYRHEYNDHPTEPRGAVVMIKGYSMSKIGLDNNKKNKQ